MNHKELTGKSIREGFHQFNEENPDIYKEFKRLCFVAINKGKNKLSAKLIIEVLRWETYLDSTDATFKINNNFHAFYARKFAKEFPQYGDMFVFRKLRTEEGGPYLNIDKDGQLNFI